jgi:phage shock protein A
VPAPPPAAQPESAADAGARGALDQLSRIEDKTARIEEKYARTETLLNRVQDKVDAATGRIGEVALQGDMIALRNQFGTLSERVRKIPGAGTLIATAVVTALLTSAITVALLRYLPEILPR